MRKVFEAGLAYDGNAFFSSYIHPAFICIYDQIKARGLFFLSLKNSRDTSTDDNYKAGLDSEGKLKVPQEQLAYLIVELIVESFFQNEYAHNNNGPFAGFIKMQGA